MRLDGKGRILIVDKTTGDGVALDLGSVCCSNFAAGFSKVLNAILNGEISFKDYTDSTSGTTTYTGMKVAFLDKDGKALIETQLDGTNGKPDFLDTGYEKVIEFKGEVVGSDTSEAYITKIAISLVAIDTATNTAVEYQLGISDAPAISPFAEIISGTTVKGLKVTLDKKFGFVFDFVMS
jgi:hypothetical protein